MKKDGMYSRKKQKLFIDGVEQKFEEPVDPLDQFDDETKIKILKNQNEILQKTIKKIGIDEVMKTLWPGERGRWCESRECWCLGAANCSGNLGVMGFTREEWEDWMKRQENG